MATTRRTSAAWLLASLFAAPASGQSNDFSLKPRGYVQMDFRSFRNWEPAVGNIDLARDERELRRFRIGLEGSYRSLRFEVDADLSDADDVLDADGVVKDAFAEMRLSRSLRLRGGQFKLPFDEEQLDSASRTDMVERSLFTMAVAPGRDLGLMARGRLGQRYSYAAGLFAGDGRTDDSRSDVTAAGRLVFAPRDGLHLGAGATFGVLSEGDAAAPHGLSGTSTSGYLFSPARHVDGIRSRGVLNASWRRGRLALKSTAGVATDTRHGQGANFEDLPAIVTWGWAASAHWLVTGVRSGQDVEPVHSIFAGPGAIEASLRFEGLSVDDAGAETGASSPALRAHDVRAAKANTLTAGLSWWPTRWMRMLGNASWERFASGEIAPEPGRRGEYFTVSARLQLQLP
jgi:phosphate-selective porin